LNSCLQKSIKSVKSVAIEKGGYYGCDPNMQRKMFRDAFEAASFPRENHIGIEIRNLDTDGAYNVIKEAITQGG